MCCLIKVCVIKPSWNKQTRCCVVLVSLFMSFFYRVVKVFSVSVRAVSVNAFILVPLKGIFFKLYLVAC